MNIGTTKLDIQAAQAARAAKIAYAKENLKLQYADSEHWLMLSRKHSFRMPVYFQPASETRYVKRLFKHVGIDIKDYLEHCGVKSLKELVSLNPQENACAGVGYALEYVDERSNVPVNS